MTFISKFKAAEEQLFDSINLYIEGRYFSAATLAGAAEEIFGRILEHQGKENSLKSANNLQNSVLKAINQPLQPINITANKLYKIRNNLKHITPKRKGDSVLEFKFYPDFQSSMLRAIHNYEALKKGRTIDTKMKVAIHSFKQEFRLKNKRA